MCRIPTRKIHDKMYRIIISMPSATVVLHFEWNQHADRMIKSTKCVDNLLKVTTKTAAAAANYPLKVILDVAAAS